jgi:Leucine-rich repeat (LRR) protein
MRAFASAALTDISLARNRLIGTIPAELFLKPGLRRLSLDENRLKGRIPDDISEATSLLHLELNSPGLITGSIPHSLTKLKQLEFLVVVSTAIYSTIPEDIGDMSSLAHLELSFVIRGSIPKSIGRLSNLTILKLSTELIGIIPEEIGNLTMLETLQLANSPNLQGTIPSSIGRLKNLKFLRLSDLAIRDPLPSALGELKNLEDLEIQNLHMIEDKRNRTKGLATGIPEEVYKLKKLKRILLANSGLGGTISTKIRELTSLTDLQLNQNLLSGTIPQMPPQPMLSINLDDNQLEGTIDSLADTKWWPGTPTLLILSNNKLYGTIPPALFAQPAWTISLHHNFFNGTLLDDALEKAVSLDFSWNLMSGTLPWKFSNLLVCQLSQLFLSNNMFTGPVPAVYAQLPELKKLDLSWNKLSGNLEGWGAELIIPRQSSLEIDISHNDLTGQLEALSNLTSMSTLVLSDNHLSGSIPSLPPFLGQLDLARNYFNGTLNSLAIHQLVNIDLSSNEFIGSVPSTILRTARIVNLANNRLSGPLTPWPLSSSNLNLLDLSFNQLSGASLSLWEMSALLSLSVKGNQLEGEIFPVVAPQLATLDISHNRFSMSVNRFHAFTKLLTLDASHNRLSGAPSDLEPLKFLKLADLSSNKLGGHMELAGLQSLFALSSLRQLFIDKNPLMPVVDKFSSFNGPWRTQESQPNPTYPSFVDCYTLTFAPKITGQLFLFDEELFNWEQCDCASGAYGAPPYHCYHCPGTDSAHCGARRLNVSANFYAYTEPLDPDWASKWPLYGIIHNSSIHVESCIVSLAATASNCKGVQLTISPGQSSPPGITEYFDTLRDSQCMEGSSGRLCSHCECNYLHDSDIPNKNGKEPSSTTTSNACYYKRGFLCAKCARTYKLSQTIPLLIVLVIIVTVALSLLMLIILRSRRQARDKSWQSLSMFRRFWYRLVDTSKFGFISILILFLQILVALTHWDAIILRAFSELMNGKGEQIGIVCLFPSILSNSAASLIVQLLIPFIISAILACSVGLAELMYRWVAFWKIRKLRRLESDPDVLSPSLGLIDGENVSLTRLSVDYPTTALLASNTLMVFQFFYFSVSLTATEYFFPEIQAHSGIKYVQAHPWMLYAEASVLRGISIPFLIVVVLGLPLSFIVFAWHFRHKVASPKIKAYVGSIFSRYRAKLFWWEAVNLVKKLVIALLIRGVAASNPLQSVFISLAVFTPMMAQTALRPWRRFLENVMDPIGGALIILTLSVVSIAHSTVASIIVFTLDGIYILSIAILVVYYFMTEKTEYQILWEASYGNLESMDTTPHKPLLFSSASDSDSPSEAEEGELQ